MKKIEKDIKSLTSSIMGAIFLLFICMLIFIVLNLTQKNYRWYDALFTSSLIYICFVGLWTLIRIGFAEGIIVRVKNYQQTRMNKISLKPKEKININELRKERKKKEWVSLSFSWIISISLLAISLIFTYM